MLTGAVHTIEAKISEVAVSGLSTSSVLTGMRINQVYEKQTAGAIVMDLVGRAGLGETIYIMDMPDNRMNGEFEVASVSHIFNKTEGFVSVVRWVRKITIS